MRRIFTFIVFALSCTVSLAQQFPSEIFHEGRVILLSEDTIKGQIKYNFKNDLIEVIIGNVEQTLTARKIISFTIFDKTIDMYRSFYSIPYNLEPNYKVPMLFEVLFEGKLSLLSRETIVEETIPQYSYYYRGTYNYTRTRLSYEYYFLPPRGKLTKYNLKKFELYDLMNDREPQIKQYIKKNSLKTDDRSDLIRIVSYYNSLIGG
jgi:hypothetical protein